MASSTASVIKFNDLCKALEATRCAKHLEKCRALIEFLKNYRAKGAELQTNNPNLDISFYPILRLLLPQLERERKAYGLKEHTLAKRLIKILCLAPNGSDASRLSNFRASTDVKNKDFADVAYWVLRKNFTKGARLSVADVNRYLDALALKNSENDPRGADDTLFKLLRESSADEQKWLIRIILKDLKLGVGQDRMLRLYHPDAADLYATNENLKKVCETLRDPSVRLHEIQIEVFTPFRPMLSQRCDVGQFKKSVTGSKLFFVETKFDGERFQLHMQDGSFKYFSRNGYDYSSTFGADFKSGVYTPLLRNAFKPHVKRIILDGEMMGWDSKNKCFGSKGMNFDVKHLTKDTRYQPCLCIFDLLVLNDMILTNKPLRERLLLLDTTLTPVQGVIMISYRTEASTKQHILNALNKSMDRKEEGVIFKDPASIYKPNDRKAGWWKMKLEYFENVMSDLDVIIMGGYYGDGRLRQKVSGFSVGVAVASGTGGLKPSAYYSLARVASGLNNEELDVIEKKLGAHWRKFDREDPADHGLEWGKDKPDVWVPPEKSCVVLVRATELIRTLSGDFKLDYTLRFPRILKIRLDKPYYDCMTTVELQELTGERRAVTKLNKRYLELSDLDTVSDDRKKPRRTRYVPEEEQPVDQLTRVLSGHEFCVLTGTQEWSKEAVESAVRENGGTVVKNEGTRTLCMLIGEHHPRVDSCRQFNVQHDLVKLGWLRSVLDDGAFRPYTPAEVLHASTKTKNRFMANYDKYGDSFTEDATSESLEEVKRLVDESRDYVNLMPCEVDALEKEMKCVNVTNVFKGCVGYFDKEGSDYRVHENRTGSEEEFDFRFLGGRVSRLLNEDVTHVVLENRNEERKTELLEYLSNFENTQVEFITWGCVTEKMDACKSALRY